MNHRFSAIRECVGDGLFSCVSERESVGVPIHEVECVVDCDSHCNASGQDPCDIDAIAKPSHCSEDQGFWEDVWDHDQQSGSDPFCDKHHDWRDQ